MVPRRTELRRGHLSDKGGTMGVKREFNEDGSCKHAHISSPRPGTWPQKWFVNCAWCREEPEPGEKLNPLDPIARI